MPVSLVKLNDASKFSTHKMLVDRNQCEWNTPVLHLQLCAIMQLVSDSFKWISRNCIELFYINQTCFHFKSRKARPYPPIYRHFLTSNTSMQIEKKLNLKYSYFTTRNISWKTFTRGPGKLLSFDLTPVLQCGGGPSSDFLTKMLSVDTPLFLCNTKF